MKFTIDLVRVERKTMTLYADSPQDAVKLAQHDGFAAESVHVMGVGDRRLEFLEVAGTCEACGDPVFYPKFVETEDGVKLCLKCVKKEGGAT